MKIALYKLIKNAYEVARVELATSYIKRTVRILTLVS